MSDRGPSLPADAPVEVERLIAAEHPAFAGHFPGAPVLPGAALLALVVQAAGDRLGGPALCVEQIKFLAGVTPGQRIVIRLRPQGDALDFDVRRGATTVARGRLAPLPAG